MVSNKMIKISGIFQKGSDPAPRPWLVVWELKKKLGGK